MEVGGSVQDAVVEAKWVRAAMARAIRRQRRHSGNAALASAAEGMGVNAQLSDLGSAAGGTLGTGNREDLSTLQDGADVSSDPLQQQRQQLEDQEQRGEAGASATRGGDGGGPRTRPLRCAVVNNRGWHLDVAAGLAWAFQAAGCEVTLYLPNKNVFGIQEVMEGWFRGALHPASQVLDDAHLFDVFALATFPETHAATLDALMNARLPRRSAARRLSQRFVAVVHNPDLLLRRRKPARWARYEAMTHAQQGGGGALPAPRPRRLQLITLAPFASAYLKALLEAWAGSTRGPAGSIEVPWLVPVAPWLPSFAVPSQGVADVSNAGSEVFRGSHAHRHLCIQGILDPLRRDYASAFEAVSHPAVLAALRHSGEQLLLLGHVSSRSAPVVPAHLAGVARNVSGLPYREYYDTLSRCRAILPALASDVYLLWKTSSTLATAVNVGTPLVAEDRVPAAYSYLSPLAVLAFRPPPGSRQPDVAAAAAADAGRYAWMDADAMLGGADPQQAGDQLRVRAAADAAEGAEDPGAAGGGAAKVVELQDDDLRRLASGVGLPRRQVQQQKGATEGHRAGGSGSGTAASAGGTQPLEGSYSAALLSLFAAGASDAAHAATRRVKAELLRHNRDVAARFLDEAVQLAAAAERDLEIRRGAAVLRRAGGAAADVSLPADLTAGAVQ